MRAPPGHDQKAAAGASPPGRRFGSDQPARQRHRPIRGAAVSRAGLPGGRRRRGWQGRAAHGDRDRIDGCTGRSLPRGRFFRGGRGARLSRRRGGPGADRRRRQRRRDPVERRDDSRHESRGMAPRAARQPEQRVSLQPGGDPRDAGARLGAHRQHVIRALGARACANRPIRRVEGRYCRLHPIARPGARRTEHHRERDPAVDGRHAPRAAIGTTGSARGAASWASAGWPSPRRSRRSRVPVSDDASYVSGNSLAIPAAPTSWLRRRTPFSARV